MGTITGYKFCGPSHDEHYCPECTCDIVENGPISPDMLLEIKSTDTLGHVQLCDECLSEIYTADSHLVGVAV